jgi:HEAT repeat protein
MMEYSEPQTWNGIPIPREASIEELRNIIGTPGPQAWAAVRALVDKAEPDALTALVELTQSNDLHLRRAGVEAIGIHALGQSASDVVCRLLHDQQSFVVRSAIEAAARLNLRAAHEQVLNLTEASDDSTRLQALRGLASLWEGSDFEPVFDRYLHDPSDGVRRQAAWTLRQNADADCCLRLFAAWSIDPLGRHRAWACQLAEWFGSKALLPELDRLRRDADGHVRKAAIRAADRLITL